MRIVYVTGCLGFIGFHLTKRCLDLGWYVIGVDKETYAANKQFLPLLKEYKNFKYVKEDIQNLDYLLDCDYVINTAAESHVDNSIVGSEVFLDTNIYGVHNLLNLLQKNKFKVPTFLHFSTDEVYGDIEIGSHCETDLLKPSNPYSATKAGADMLISAWARTHEIPWVIVRPTNNYGIGQYVEKLIPKSVKYMSIGRKIPLHQNGTPRRTWLHVSDTVEAIVKIIEGGAVNEIFNISGNYEESNLEIAKKIIKLVNGSDSFEDFIDFKFSRPGQDVRYSINDEKLKKLGWAPKADFDTELDKIVKYYKENFVW